MPTSSESIDQSAELTFTRDASRPGYVHVHADVFDGEDSYSYPLGTYSLRDLLIALHAVQIDSQEKVVDKIIATAPPKPRRRRWFG